MNLTLEQLVNIEVTSVSKKQTDLFKSPAAIYVITQEDIRRSGLTSIPELLRMVPGLDVAQIDANHWAISARGFNEQYANKLLVLDRWPQRLHAGIRGRLLERSGYAPRRHRSD